jgi:hypothetical protein
MFHVEHCVTITKSTGVIMAATEKRNMQLPGIPKKMGRPVTGKAKSDAERQAAARARRSIERETELKVAKSLFKGMGEEALGAAVGAWADNPELAFKAWVYIGWRRGWLA